MRTSFARLEIPAPMSVLRIRASLEYELGSETSFYFSLVAAQTDHQLLRHEALVITPHHVADFLPYGIGGHQLFRFTAQPGPLSIDYRATVELDPQRDDPHALAEVPFSALPSEVLVYLNPSRYCESDKLVGFAQRHFGSLAPGYKRVEAISQWVGEQMTYLPGSTDGSSSAADALLLRAGVCRDFAHVGISLCRALGIPARYLSGYGIGVEPQDFHGFFEAWLDGDWYLFDPTAMAPADGLVRIGLGRDAADAPFASFVGQASLTAKTITVERDPVRPVAPDESATSTA